jgi:transposase
MRVVELARAGRSISSLAKEFKITPTTIRSWKLQADRDEGVRTDGLTSDEKKELAQLRRENARLREEREILSKAAAWFAQERVGTHKKRSDS